MDISINNLKLNFADGLEFYPCLVFKLENSDLCLSIWEGFVADLSGKGCKGMTRDYLEMKGVWDDEGKKVEIDVSEYLNDLSY